MPPPVTAAAARNSRCPGTRPCTAHVGPPAHRRRATRLSACARLHAQVGGHVLPRVLAHDRALAGAPSPVTSRLGEGPAAGEAAGAAVRSGQQLAHGVDARILLDPELALASGDERAEHGATPPRTSDRARISPGGSRSTSPRSARSSWLEEPGGQLVCGLRFVRLGRLPWPATPPRRRLRQASRCVELFQPRGRAAPAHARGCSGRWSTARRCPRRVTRVGIVDEARLLRPLLVEEQPRRRDAGEAAKASQLAPGRAVCTTYVPGVIESGRAAPGRRRPAPPARSSPRRPGTRPARRGAGPSPSSSTTSGGASCRSARFHLRNGKALSRSACCVGS